MEPLPLFGWALGLASLAGLNLYLTVFVTGLAVNQHWIDAAFPELAILGRPAILALSGTLYLVQFFADKIPWVDSLWDALHTLIRPVGGALLAVRVLGNPDPAIDVVVALLAGSATMLVHGLKSGTRLIINHSPEPFSNIALSLGEDAIVLGGLALIKHNPTLALGIFAVVLFSIAYFTPRLLRAVKVQLWLLWKKLGFPARDQGVPGLANHLPPRLRVLLPLGDEEALAWSAPCVSSSAKGLTGNLFGYLVASSSEPEKVWFVARSRWRKVRVAIPLAGYHVVHEPKFLSENLVFDSLEKKPKYQFLFERTQSAVVAAIIRELEPHLGQLVNEPQVESPSPH